MLSLLKAGDTILVSKPFGTFTKVKDNAVFVAAGTGIAKFMSMLQIDKVDVLDLFTVLRTLISFTFPIIYSQHWENVTFSVARDVCRDVCMLGGLLSS